VGEIVGGVQAWVEAGHPVTTITLLGAEALGGRSVLDVRRHSEYVTGHVPTATHVERGELANRVPGGFTSGAAGSPGVVMCGHGERATTAGSLLERAGHRQVAVGVGGPEEWSAATGHALRTGS